MEAIEKQFILTGVVNLSEFFRVSNENTKTCTFDAIPPSEFERLDVEKDKEKEIEDWIESVLK